MSTPVNETTANYGLPLPHPGNPGEDDCLRLRQALTGVDAALKSVADDVETKADAADINLALEGFAADMATVMEQKADATATAEALALKADSAAVTDSLALKADAATVALALESIAAELALKSDATATAEALALKADANAVTASLALKADTSTVTAALATKADTAATTAELAKKANANAVTASLALKADAATVNTELAKKSNAATVTAALATKADTATVNTALAKKADTTALAALAASVDGDIAALASRVDMLEKYGVAVILTPTITGPASAPIGYAVIYTVSASSYFQNGSIPSFRYKFGTIAEQTVNATNGSATFPITVPAGTAVGAKFTLTVVAVDNYGNECSATKEVSAITASVTTPTLTSPAANAVVRLTSIALASNAFAATGASDTHAASHWKLCFDAAGANVLWQSGRNTTSKISITATPTANALTPGGTVYAFVKHEGVILGEGAWSACVKLTVVSVNAPTISSPTAGATVCSSGVTITTSAFTCSGGISDTHASTDWKITSDADGNNVLVQALASANKTSHTFTGISITDGATYYLWSRHNGTSCGASLWSAVRNVIIKTGVTTASGRLLYRHGSGKGTVMEFNDGQLRKVLVLDAQYRDGLKWGTHGYNLPYLTSYSSTNTRDDWYLNTSNAVNTNAATKMTDAQINSLWSGSIDAKTAKQNCDEWMTRNGFSDPKGISGVPTVAYARSVSVDGNACDVPNIQTLMRIFLEADELDNLDPTVAANKKKALGYQNSGGFWNCMGTGVAWASTEYGSNGVRYVRFNGNCYAAGKEGEYFVVPVQEL